MVLADEGNRRGLPWESCYRAVITVPLTILSRALSIRLPKMLEPVWSQACTKSSIDNWLALLLPTMKQTKGWSRKKMC